MTDRQSPLPHDAYCSTLSREAGEQQFASAPRADVWVLLEHPGPWGAQAFAESRVPDAVKAHVDGWLRAIPHARLQLIRQLPPARAGIGEHSLFVALARETGPALYRAPFDAFEDLLAVDVPALAAGNPDYARFRQAGELFLICANARRDKCCGKFGPPVYARFVERAGTSVWECTHLGGHRFAPTGAWLPQGLCFGRLGPGDVDAWLDACRAGRVDLAHTRGRSCYATAEQAAEYFLRAETGELALDAYRRVATRTPGPEEWETIFATAAGVECTVRVARERSVIWSYESCRAEQKAEIVRWRKL